VEPAEDARPEVQATTITVKVTPARRQESMATKYNSLLLRNSGESVERTLLSAAFELDVMYSKFQIKINFKDGGQ
jgi:hypothetical protein